MMMKAKPRQQSNSLPPHIQERFQHLPRSASPDFAQSLKQRVHDEVPNEPADRILDALLLPDPSLGHPDMPRRIRQRMLQTAPSPSSRLLHFPWQRFIAPVAAAATLALAFVSFQQEAPDYPQQHPAAELAYQNQYPQNSDAELTQIFALAQNLKPAVQVDQLRSPEAFPFLMQ